MKPPKKIELDLDQQLRATLVITCGDCSSKTRVALAAASPGRSYTCRCGGAFTLAGEDLRGAQRALDDLKRTLQSFE